ncbi:hypothetical protein BDR07DRAFT_1017418 [Suillus spraguei]|nr:hypothetical protein BDR07DRAFT_1017418 [Suillus spraguei]
MHFNVNFDDTTKSLYSLPMSSIPDDGLQMEHTFYYFKNVHQLQYAFASNSVANITHSLVLQHQQALWQTLFLH